MKARIFLSLLASLVCMPLFSYNDYRGHKLDSLERAVARWTPDALDNASLEELVQLNRDCRDLMLGYNVINGEKCLFYARKALSISHPRGWNSADADVYRYIGQSFYGREQYDSALFYYKASLAAVDAMAGGAVSPTNPDGYSQYEIDDSYSALYGAIGNLYNMMGDIPTAMEYYGKAGELFEKNGWNESNSVLYYNIGETWVDEGDLKAAEKAYCKAMDYALAADDSLMVAGAQKGLGRLYLAKGQTWKALRYLHQADEYYSCHDIEEPSARKDLFQYMSMALESQRRLLGWTLCAVVLLLLLSIGIILLGRRLRRARQEQSEAAAVIEETLEELSHKDGPDVKLSAREKEILDLLSKGYTSRDIADALHLSPETIKWYRKKLLVKFDVANVAELVLKAK